MKLEKKDLPVLGFRTTMQDLPNLFSTGKIHFVVESDHGPIDVALPEGLQVFMADVTARAFGGCAIVIAEEPTMKPAGAAALLGVSRPMIYKWIEQGLLQDRPVGGDHRVTAESVEALSERRRQSDRRAQTLMDEEPDSPRVVAARERVRAKRVARA